MADERAAIFRPITLVADVADLCRRGIEDAYALVNGAQVMIGILLGQEIAKPVPIRRRF